MRPVPTARGVERLRDLRRRGDPHRTVEGAGEVGRHYLGDLDRGLRAADLGELDAGDVAGPFPDRLFRLGARLDALVAGDRDRGCLADCRQLFEPGYRLLGELYVEGLDLGQDALRGFDVPGRVRVDANARFRTDCLPHRPHRAHLAHVVAGAELQLEGGEAVLRPGEGVGGHGRGLA